MHAHRFFDYASTTPCCEEALGAVICFAREEYGNPTSHHAMGEAPERAIREARLYFADYFGVSQPQVIFTGSGTESDNLAITGIALAQVACTKQKPADVPSRIVISSIEHPAVSETAHGLSLLGFEVVEVNVDRIFDAINNHTILVSIMTVNNITGAVLPVEKLATQIKAKRPDIVIHTDAIQAFGKIDVSRSSSAVDLISLSAHKIEGPKGVGALIVLNRDLLRQKRLLPLVRGGGQESAMRSGTQNAGLIAGFGIAARKALTEQKARFEKIRTLAEHFKNSLIQKDLIGGDVTRGPILWNSPQDAIPHIVSISIPGQPASAFAHLLESRGCIVSTGSACASKGNEPDPVLSAMGHGDETARSALRVSFWHHHSHEDIDVLVAAIGECLELTRRLK